MPNKREWEVWEKPGMAEYVDGYWRSSPEELAHRRKLATLVRGLLLTKTDAILEVGCGTGLIYEALQKQLGEDLNYTGVDNSRKMLAMARKHFPEGNFKTGDAFALKYKDGAFDLGCAFEVFGHMPDCTGALSELMRVSKRTALFTLWTDGGGAVYDGGDHYVYGLQKVENIVAEAAGGRPIRKSVIGLSPVSVIVLVGLA